MFERKKIAMVVAEFLGAATLAIAVFSIAKYPEMYSIFPALVAGLTLGLMVLVVGGTSGAHINPAVTFGLWTVRKIQTTQAVVYIVAQMLGGLAAFYFLQYFTKPTEFIIHNIAGKNVDWRVIIAEAVGTFIFTFGIASAVYRKFEGLQLAATIGTSLTVGILVASFGSNGVLNPAVAYGINSFNFSYAVGPLLGATLGMNLYAMLFSDGGVSRPRKLSVATKKTTKKTKKK